MNLLAACTCNVQPFRLAPPPSVMMLSVYVVSCLACFLLPVLLTRRALLHLLMLCCVRACDRVLFVRACVSPPPPPTADFMSPLLHWVGPAFNHLMTGGETDPDLTPEHYDNLLLWYSTTSATVVYAGECVQPPFATALVTTLYEACL